MTKKLMLSAATAGLLTGSILSVNIANAAPANKAAPASKGECHGVNSCKGKGACGGKTHSCAGQNSCKGKGWIKLTKATCETSILKSAKEKGMFFKKKA